jgi:DNA helicase HerA-like ATPase
VRRAIGDERDRALGFDAVARRMPAGLSRDGEPVYIDVDFLDGTKGAHVNISGVSGVATKTTYATFLLYGLFHSDVLGPEAVNTKALVFNVKGEDLLFLDHPNLSLAPDQAERYRTLGLPAEPFASVGVWAPPRRDGVGDGVASADVASRSMGVRSFFWTIFDFCEQGLLPFLFADAEDDRQQYTMVVHNVTAELQRVARDVGDPVSGTVTFDGTVVRTFDQLVDVINERVLTADGDLGPWAGRAITGGTVNAFLRRLHGATRHLRHLVRADVARPDQHSVAFDRQVTVIDIHNLNDRAQRFVVGVLLRRAFETKERAGTAKPLQLIVLDELNKYAPREGSSPIKEIILDVAERGRSLGIVLIGCQQTASEVERRVVANSAVRVVGRLDPAEAGRSEYGFLPQVQRQRATIVKPGTMIVSQPMLPVPIVLEFPFPAWATRSGEAGANPSALSSDAVPQNPLEGLPQ